jgi:hypothetical protein
MFEDNDTVEEKYLFLVAFRISTMKNNNKKKIDVILYTAGFDNIKNIIEIINNIINTEHE